MKALLIADTHWLWYAAGRWGAKHDFRRPRVDYMELRNHVARALIERFGRVYDLECCAFVVNRRQGAMDRFIDLLRGFGYRVETVDTPTPAVSGLLTGEQWDLVVLAVGSVEALATALEAARAEGRRVLVAGFDTDAVHGDPSSLVGLDGGVLYDAGRRV